MKALGKSIPFIILVAGFVGLAALTSMRKEPPSSERQTLAPLVTTEVVQRCQDGFSIYVDGEVIPYRQINLATQVAGRISLKSPYAKAGNFVQSSSLLFEVDARDYELETRRLREMVNQASSSIEEADVERANVERLLELAEADLSLQKNDVTRFEELKAKNATSTAQVEAARRGELQVMNSLQTLKNQVLLIRARRNRLAQDKERAITSLDQALLNLSRTKITSPINGVVIEDMIEQDDYVQPGTLLVRLEDTSKAEVRFNLRLEQLRWLWGSADSVATSSSTTAESTRETYKLPNLNVKIHSDMDGNHFWWAGRLDRYDGAGITMATRTVPVIAIVDDPSQVHALDRDVDALPLPAPPTLMRGAYVHIELPIGSQLDLVRIPSAALRPGNRVWVYDRGKLRIQSVRVAHTEPDSIVLLTTPNQLAAGHEVIVSPLTLEVDNMDLRRDTTTPLTARDELADETR